jgi:hypothetical protein
VRVPLGAAADAQPRVILPDGRRLRLSLRSSGHVRVLQCAVEGESARVVGGDCAEQELVLRVLDAKISVVDFTPEELILVSADRLYATFASGLAGGRASRLSFSLGCLQIDNQLQDTVRAFAHIALAHAGL